MKKAKRFKSDSRCKGFTIIELLVVIGVIALLVGMLLPSLRVANIRAKETRTRNLIRIIETGLESFFTDSSVGGRYPHSFWDGSGTNGDPFGGSHKYYGAQTLVWGLAGADLLGTPGFNGNLGDGNGELYELDANDEPKCPRVGPFIDVSKATMRPLTELGPYWTVGSGGNDDAVVILDDFGMPVLYFRANTGATGMDRYDWDDNDPFLDTGYGQQSPALTTKAKFEDFIWNPIVRGRRPHNYETYILITGGYDRDYGTKDDITNYPLRAGKNY